MENYRLEKTYRISADIFREGFKAYQKKYVYPKNYVFAGIFLALTANFIYGAVKAPDNYFAYLLIVICIALAIREWFNPRKMRRVFLDTIQEMGDMEYRLRIGENFAEFSTIEHEKVENFVDEEYDNTDKAENILPTRINCGENMKIAEHDKFFLLIDGKSMFYIIPKENFSSAETEIIRSLNSEK